MMNVIDWQIKQNLSQQLLLVICFCVELMPVEWCRLPEAWTEWADNDV